MLRAQLADDQRIIRASAWFVVALIRQRLSAGLLSYAIVITRVVCAVAVAAGSAATSRASAGKWGLMAARSTDQFDV
jgi:hypothetical protein